MVILVVGVVAVVGNGGLSGLGAPRVRDVAVVSTGSAPDAVPVSGGPGSPRRWEGGRRGRVCDVCTEARPCRIQVVSRRAATKRTGARLPR